MGDVSIIEAHREKPYDEPDWTLDRFCPCSSDRGRLSVWSAFGIVKTAWSAGDIEMSTDVQGVLYLRPGDAMTISRLRTSDAVQAAAHMERDDASRHISDMEFSFKGRGRNYEQWKVQGLSYELNIMLSYDNG